MKLITCDICKRPIGHEVGFTIVCSPSYNSHEFFAGMQSPSTDICTTCYNIIGEAQIKAVEGIKANQTS